MKQTTHHMVFALRLFDTMSANTLRDCFTQENGKRPSEKTIRSHIQEMKDKGFRYYPGTGCDNFAPDGSCLGHCESSFTGISDHITE